MNADHMTDAEAIAAAKELNAVLEWAPFFKDAGVSIWVWLPPKARYDPLGPAPRPVQYPTEAAAARAFLQTNMDFRPQQGPPEPRVRGMLVADLIAALQACDPLADVLIKVDYEFGYGLQYLPLRFESSRTEIDGIAAVIVHCDY